MNQLTGPDRDVLYRTAREVTRDWNSTKAAMALRAAGLDGVNQDRASLESIAAELGVSRETVRRARNELLHAIDTPHDLQSEDPYAAFSIAPPARPSVDSPSTGRALRRLLTMTGPLAWDEVLSAWARARGKPPYIPLPTEETSLRALADRAGGIVVSAEGSGRVSVAVASPEALDRVSGFLHESLKDRPGGMDRGELLDLARKAGLKATTVATALSIHPAVARVGRGTWTLRGRHLPTTPAPAISEVSRARRARPTTFEWAADGSLLIEFSVPRGPSPVVAIPKAVSNIVEGREFALDHSTRSERLTVRNARVWGFGQLLSELHLGNGSRATLALNLLDGTAVVAAAEGKRSSR